MCKGHCVHHLGDGMPAFLQYRCCHCGQPGSQQWADKHPPDTRTAHGVFMPRHKQVGAQGRTSKV